MGYTDWIREKVDLLLYGGHNWAAAAAITTGKKRKIDDDCSK